MVSVRIESGEQEYEFECAQGETILFESLTRGIPLQYSCATGRCGACVARVISGAVVNMWPNAPGLSKQQKSKGRVLLCQSTVNEDASFRVSELATMPRNASLESASVGSRNRSIARWFAGEIKDVSELSRNLFEVWLELDAPMTFTPGQFVVLRVPGLTGGRAFSIANMEDDPISSVRLLLKPRFQSELYELLSSQDLLNRRVQAFGPLGTATLATDDAADDIICIAGSTGLAPMLPILVRWARNSVTSHAELVYAVRSSKDAVCLRDISALVKQAHNRLKVTIALSEAQSGDVSHLSTETSLFATVRCGFAHEVLESAVNGSALGGIAFVAGPKPMVEATTRTLMLKGGLTAGAIRCDDFG